MEHVSEFPYLGSSIAANGRINDASSLVKSMALKHLAHYTKGGLSHFPPKFKNIFVVVITFVAYCVCFKMICKKSL